MNPYDGDAFDEAFLKPWLALEQEFKLLGKPLIFDIESWTLELGSGMTINPDSVQRGLIGIKNYLAFKGILKIENFPVPQTANYPIKLVPKTQIKKYYAPQGGMFTNYINIGDSISKNSKIYDILSFDKDQHTSTITPVFAEADGLVLDIATNHSVNEFDYVLSVMETP